MGDLDLVMCNISHLEGIESLTNLSLIDLKKSICLLFSGSDAE